MKGVSMSDETVALQKLMQDLQNEVDGACRRSAGLTAEAMPGMSEQDFRRRVKVYWAEREKASRLILRERARLDTA